MTEPEHTFLLWLKNVTEPVAARPAEPVRQPRRVLEIFSRCPLIPDCRGHATVGGAA